MNIRSIKTIDDRHILGSAAVKARADREVKRKYGLSQLDLDILLCIGDLSASHRTQFMTVPELVFFIGYSESNSVKVYNRVDSLSCDETPLLEKNEGKPASYSVTGFGAKVIRYWLDRAKMCREDVRIFGND